MCFEIIYLVYINKKGLTFNNLQWLICHKTKTNQTFLKGIGVKWIQPQLEFRLSNHLHHQKNNTCQRLNNYY